MNRKFCLAGLLCLIAVFSGCATAPVSTIKPPEYAQAKQLFEAVDFLAEKLMASSGQREIGKIAVADFTGPDEIITGIGEHFSDKLTLKLFASGKFSDVMERKQLKQIISSIKIEHSGYFDQNTVTKYGKMIGVDSMVIGTVKDMGSFLDVTAKIVQSKTGRIQGAADVRVIKDESVMGLMGRQKRAVLTISTVPPAKGSVVAGGKQERLVNGTAVFSGIAYGECKVVIQPEGYTPVHKSVSIRSADEAVSVRLVEKRYSVSFQVVPPDAKLTVDGKRMKLNSQGYTKVSDLKSGTCSYFAEAKGHESRLNTFNPADTQTIAVNLKTDDPFFALRNKFFQKYKKIRESQDFNIRLWADKGSYNLNDPICFAFRSEKDCYLVLVNIGSSGNITQIFPNRFHADNYIKGGVTYRIPDESYGFGFRVEGPAGTERVYAVAGTRPVNVFNNDFSSRSFTSLTRGRARDINVYQTGARLDQAKLDAAAECIVYKEGGR